MGEGSAAQRADLRRQRGHRRSADLRRRRERRREVGAPAADACRSRRSRHDRRRQGAGLARGDARGNQGRSRRGSVPQHAPRPRSRLPRAALRGDPRHRGSGVRARDRGDAQPDRRHRPGPLRRRGTARARDVHAEGAHRGDDSGRERADPLHVGNHEGPQGRGAHPCVHLGAADASGAVARRAGARRRLVHGRHGMGQGGLERVARALVARLRGGNPRECVRPRGAPLARPATRRDRAVPGADGVPDAREARRPRLDAPAEAQTRGVGRGAAQPRGHRAVPGRARADGPRRVRADRKLAARREPAGRSRPAGLDGTADRGPRRGCDRRVGGRLRGRCRRRHCAPGATADALPRLLGRSGRDGGDVPRRLVRHRRPRRARRAGIPVVRRPDGRRDPLVCVSHRPLRGRERVARASCGGRERRGRRAGSRARADRQGIRRRPTGTRAWRAPGGRAAGPCQDDHRAVQVPPRDLVRRGAPEDLERQDPTRRASRDR